MATEERVYTKAQLAPRVGVSRALEKLGVWAWNTHIVKWEFGLLPREYNFKVHGPYQPHRFYGKPDTPFGQVKLGEMAAWLGRRDKNPVAFGRMVGRGVHFWSQRFGNARYGNANFLWQFMVLSAAGWYLIHFERHSKFRQARYHW